MDYEKRINTKNDLVFSGCCFSLFGNQNSFLKTELMEEHCRECGLNLWNADEDGLEGYFDNSDPICADCAIEHSNSVRLRLIDVKQYLKDTLEFGVDRQTLKGKIKQIENIL